MSRPRLDKLMTERGLATSRERAQALILAGRVLVNEQKVAKAGAAVDPHAAIRVLGDDLRYVSRGGLKLERALAHWQIALTGERCLDIGASTGGFTDCMLQHGAAQVAAIDTGYGQIDARLRADPRVILREKTNARYLRASDLPFAAAFIAMDVSFISVTLVLPAVVTAGFQAGGGTLVILVKPQFEVGRGRVGKGGIVRDPAAQAEAVAKVTSALERLRAQAIEAIESPILGAEGNREFLLRAKLIRD